MGQGQDSDPVVRCWPTLLAPVSQLVLFKEAFSNFFPALGRAPKWCWAGYALYHYSREHHSHCGP